MRVYYILYKQEQKILNRTDLHTPDTRDHIVKGLHYMVLNVVIIKTKMFSILKELELTFNICDFLVMGE